MKQPSFSLDDFKEHFSYDPNTGYLTRLKDVGRAKAGTTAGSDSHGYTRVSFRNEQYCAHHLAFFYMTGEWPAFEVDHENLIRSDNRWSNIRKSDRSANAGNQTVRSTNVLQTKGVGIHKKSGRFHARIMKDGKCKSLGLHDTKELAAAAYAKAANESFGEFARIS